MYESYFGLTEKPFSLNPDPDYLYLGRGHSRALAMLEYGVAQETGVVVITGEVGSGKTTLVRHLLNQLDDSYTVGMITNTHSSFGELIHWISSAFGLKHEGRDKVALYNQFVDFIISEYAAGRRVLVIVDEAQNMTAETLEELRVISNINADKDIVMQLVLVGQPELRDTLGTPELRQFVQRISAFYYLKPLEASEITLYIEHRLKKAGCDRKVFDYGAIYLIHEHSAGIPRIINTLCNLGLTYAFGVQSERVTEEIMREVVEDRAEHGLFGIEHLSLGEDGMRKVTKKKTTRKKAAAKKTTAKKTAAKKATTKKATTKKATTKKATAKKTAATAGADNDDLRATGSASQTDEQANAESEATAKSDPEAKSDDKAKSDSKAESDDKATGQASGAPAQGTQDLFAEAATGKAEGADKTDEVEKTAGTLADAAATQSESATDKPVSASGQLETPDAATPTATVAGKDPAVVREIVEASMFDVTSEFERLPGMEASSTEVSSAEGAGEAPDRSTEPSTSMKESPSDTLAGAGAGADAEKVETSANGELPRDAQTDAPEQASADAPEEPPEQAGVENDLNSIERLFGSATNRHDTTEDQAVEQAPPEGAVEQGKGAAGESPVGDESKTSDASSADEGEAAASASATESVANASAGAAGTKETAEATGKSRAKDEPGANARAKTKTKTKTKAKAEATSKAKAKGPNNGEDDAASAPDHQEAAGNEPKTAGSSEAKPNQEPGLDAILAAVEGVLADHERRDSDTTSSSAPGLAAMPQKRPLAEAISDAVRSSAQAGGQASSQATSAQTSRGGAKIIDERAETDAAIDLDASTSAEVRPSAAEPSTDAPAEATPAPRLVPRIEVNLNEEPDRPAGLMRRLRSFFNGG